MSAQAWPSYDVDEMQRAAAKVAHEQMQNQPNLEALAKPFKRTRLRMVVIAVSFLVVGSVGTRIYDGMTGAYSVDEVAKLINDPDEQAIFRELIRTAPDNQHSPRAAKLLWDASKLKIVSESRRPQPDTAGQSADVQVPH